MDDFNYDILDDTKGLPLVEFSQDLGLLIYPTDFTHSVDVSKSKLDIVLTNTFQHCKLGTVTGTPLCM